MKKFIILLLLVLPLSVFAQGLKIAYVNTNDVFNAMPELSAMETKMADLQKQYDTDLKQMQDEYTKKYTNYIAQQDSLTDNIKLRRQQEIQDLEERIQNFVPVARQDMEKKQQELFVPIQQKVFDAIKSVGDENGFTFILDRSALLYASTTATDATSLVKTKLGLK